MSRKLKVELDDVLAMVSCAEDYGYGQDECVGVLAEWTGPVSDKEIEAHAAQYLGPEAEADGYTEEDYESIIGRLTDWRDRYASPKNKKRVG